MEKLSIKNAKQANKAKNKRPVKVVYISNPMKVKASAAEFRSVVQELTGQDSDVDNLFSPTLAEVQDSDVDNLFSPTLAEVSDPWGASPAESNSCVVDQGQRKRGPAAADGGSFDPCGDVAGGSCFDSFAAETFSPQMHEVIGYNTPPSPLYYELQGNNFRDL